MKRWWVPRWAVAGARRRSTGGLGCLVFVLLAGPVAAAADPFLGVYRGQGRACTGGLFLRQRTLEWNASFFRCGPVSYRRIEQDGGARPRVALRISHPGKACRFEVVEIHYFSEWSWTINGYPSMEAYEHRREPDWKDSVDPAREVASCGMRKD